MHVYVVLHDYTMSVNLSVYAFFVAQFVSFVHVFVCPSDLPGFFSCIFLLILLLAY